MLLAVMDLGSNSFKMTVAQWAPEVSSRRPFRVLHKERHPIQLGASVFSRGEISEKDFKAAVKVLARMQARLRDFSSPVLRVVATSAIRDAANGHVFVDVAREELGLPIDVISGSVEARLIAEGLSWEYPRVQRGLLIDIGGGSTEIASFGDGWDRSFCHSFRMGSVRLAMQSFRGEGAPELERVRRALSAQMARHVPPRGAHELIGSAGTIQSLGAILGGATKVKVVRKAALDTWIESNLNAAPQDLANQFRIPPSRARVVVPGAIILSEAMAWLGINDLKVTDMSLRDGVMVDLVRSWRAREKQMLRRASRVARGHGARDEADAELLRQLERKAQQFRVDVVGAANTAVLALAVFDGMTEAGFDFDPADRRCLMAAAYLHDAGRCIAKSGHHKHSAYILRNLDLPGLSRADRQVAALAALYHRKDPPPKKDPLPFDVSGATADRARWLAAILRMADGLNRGPTHNIWSLRFRMRKKHVFLQLFQHAPAELELDYFRAKAQYFEELFGLELSCFTHYRSSAVGARGVTKV